jgi:hypothetical protein
MKQKRERRGKILNNRFLSRNREGQFFLIAAIVIIIVVISIVTISNYSEKRDIVRLYDLGTELGIESQNVLDYGTYSALNETEMKKLMEDFARNYVEYQGENRNIYFVFGNRERINVVGYQQMVNESVCVRLDEGNCSTLTIGSTQEFTKGAETIIDKVAIELGAYRYEFLLKRGENFYFVIWQEIGEDRQVVTGGTGEINVIGG